MSLPQLAELAGLSGAEVQALESGDMSLGLHKIHCISNVLNISPTAILEALDV